ncbi:acyl-CoA dehydrogenase family protein [Variovorax sp. J22R115]|uniref:acyl-CoA dehydrogenase family protein n=1 Tax=Variovorax sp. J22R115 TaxID=3053509 RepID=UPI002576EE2E|nr:acyl-CoA dehydrogenase family protein [Variovorax sp. J22R115]MDM0047430.1 acyl-CoA dehydrogenase family protein [Variovorax sp. J22R115]
MDFQLNSEQQLLKDSVRRFIDKAYGFEARAALVKAGQGGGTTQHWQTFADNGWVGAALPEAFGGLGGSLVDTAIIAQEFGRGLVIEPFLGCAVLAAQTLVAGGTAAQKDRLLPALADGSRRLALAYSEAGSRGMPTPVSLRAERKPGGYVLQGRKSLVLGAIGADQFIVSAAIPGSTGITLLLVDANAPGLQCRDLPLHDGSHAADLMFESVEVATDAVLGEADGGLPALQAGIAHAIVALCAEQVGAMEKAIEVTADYLKARKQFGVPIGSFQALQHRMADMAAEMELARSMLFAALAAMQNQQGPALQKTLSSAKAFVGRAAKAVCGQAVQLHGGIGMTEEYLVGHYFKRAVVADLLLGSADRHEAACAAAISGAVA